MHPSLSPRLIAGLRFLVVSERHNSGPEQNTAAKLKDLRVCSATSSDSVGTFNYGAGVELVEELPKSWSSAAMAEVKHLNSFMLYNVKYSPVEKYILGC